MSATNGTGGSASEDDNYGFNAYNRGMVGRDWYCNSYDDADWHGNFKSGLQSVRCLQD
ncbi:MAG: hypothetical protein LBQ87_09640 [Candidatus Fibromonas sp.]|nr:hypothetical protein [Candidatus Fibromonas sp.]